MRAMLACLLLWVGAAQADDLAVVDAYYVVSADLDAGGGLSDDGDGYGVKGRVTIPLLGLFATADLQQNSYDLAGDLDQYRLGAGIGLSLTPLVTFYGLVEYLNFSNGDDDSGGAAHGGLRVNLVPGLELGARLGYVKLEDADGTEYLFEAAYMFTDMLGAFADYRSTRLDEETSPKLDLTDIRAGVRFAF